MSSQLILTTRLQSEQDVVHARQRARNLAGLLGFDRQDQTRIATAVSEIARNTVTYGGGGMLKFSIDGPPAQRRLAMRFAEILNQEARALSDAGAAVDTSSARRRNVRLDIEK